MIEGNQSIKFIEIISNIINVLKDESYLSQTDFLVHLIDSINRENFEKFIQDINSEILWGGSGAIWEIEMRDSKKQDILMRNLADLIRQMKNLNMLGKRAKSVYKLIVK
ncbi:MAG: hypothetical protein O9294_15735 [Cytophagales bacterium]|jgi:hypothetical protein|nr:hypothetical protein [Cytophagales bacterium]